MEYGAQRYLDAILIGELRPWLYPPGTREQGGGAMEVTPPPPTFDKINISPMALHDTHTPHTHSKIRGDEPGQ